jgi:hypothetical protein
MSPTSARAEDRASSQECLASLIRVADWIRWPIRSCSGRRVGCLRCRVRLRGRVGYSVDSSPGQLPLALGGFLTRWALWAQLTPMATRTSMTLVAAAAAALTVGAALGGCGTNATTPPSSSATSSPPAAQASPAITPLPALAPAPHLAPAPAPAPVRAATPAPARAAAPVPVPAAAPPNAGSPTGSTDSSSVGSTGGSPYYANCAAARAAGVAPLHKGDPGYRSGLDRDGDGIACE